MDVQTLINSLNAGGFRVLAHGSEGVAITPSTGLSDEQRLAIREHKATLRLLACIPSGDDYEHAEREAIQFADAGGIEADLALIRARFELQEIIEPPPACDACGSLVFRWDLNGERHCIACEPGQSARLIRIAESIRKRHADMIENKPPECANTQATLTEPLDKKGNS
ncbi:MAG: hypothetical protein KDA51_19695 [Planctomycetales bacterium]|nr:hypothetical protein [Planctomycetales bacterium]